MQTYLLKLAKIISGFKIMQNTATYLQTPVLVTEEQEPDSKV